MAEEGKVCSRRDLLDILTLSDLKDESWERIFGCHLRQRVKLKSKVELSSFDGTNDFYNSEMLRARALVVVDGKEEREFNLVIKNPVTTAQKYMSKFVKVFAKENFWYRDTMEAFPELSHLSAECYHSNSNYDDSLVSPGCMERNLCCCFCCFCCCAPREKAVLVLADITKQEGEPYRLLDKTKVPSLEHINLVMKEIARFHGTWFKFLNDTDRSGYSHVRFTPDEVRRAFKLNHSLAIKFMGKMIKATFKSVTQLLRNRKADEELVSKFEEYGKNKYIPDVNRIFEKAFSQNLLTLCHSDFWLNNMMFHEDEEGRPKNVKFLDFQMMNISHPLADLGYFLFICTDKSFRDLHLRTVLRVYYDALQPFVKDKVSITFEEFHQQFWEMAPVYLFGAMGVMANVLSPNKRSLKKLSDLKKLDQQRHQEIASPDHPDDHPMTLEIRRRLVAVAQEYHEKGVF